MLTKIEKKPKIRKCLVYFKKVSNYVSYIQVIKLFEYNLLWNCLEFSDKMDLTFQTRISDNLEDDHTICLKFGGRFFTSLTMLELNQKLVSTLQLNNM